MRLLQGRQPYVNEIKYKPLEVYDQRFKKMDYIYDLVSGNTNAMRYQYGEPDYFEHKYGYDADNRLIYVNTTRDGLTWDQDEKQGYYLHGPLGRREIGHHKVQNMDYAYTVNGWLKGVNGAALDEQKEMGQDGKVTNLSTTPYYADYTDIHQWTGRDAFGYVIGYFGDDTLAMRDYTSITATTNGNRWLCKIPITTGLGNNLYNGNIRHVVLGIMDHNESTTAEENRATAYKHDQLQRLKETYNYFYTGSDYSTITSAGLTGLREKVWYDANGNITALNRYDDAGTPALMDDFSYNYYGNVNRLGHVDDAVSTGGISTDKEDQNPNNYSYDEIGQLTADVKEGISNINWNVRNKPVEIAKTGDVKILFEYDELGHRVKKEVRDGTENLWTQQWYVLDPQGNPVAVYEHKYTNPSTNTYNEYLDLKEHQIYGGERLGTRNYENYHLWGQTFTSTSFTVEGEFNSPSGHSPLGFLLSSYELHKRKTGMKTYEIKGHTNNVQAVVTDYKVPFVTGCSGVSDVEYYLPDVVSYTDYFVFGGVMNNRNTSSNGYRYGFQGQERDNEIKGNDNSVNYEYRMHDPQYGRFLSIDPLASKYPQWSPYVFSGNQVIHTIELEGLEPEYNLSFSNPGEGPLRSEKIPTPVMGAITGEEAEGDLAFGPNNNICAYSCGQLKEDGTIYGEGYYNIAPYIQYAFSSMSFGTGNIANVRFGYNKLIPSNNLDPFSGKNNALFDYIGESSKSFWSYAAPEALERPAFDPVDFAAGMLSGLRSAFISGTAKGTSTATIEKVTFEYTENFVDDAIVVYHKGQLNGGIVSSTRSLSTGIERTTVEALERSGQVWQFNIPRSVFQEWQLSGKVTKLIDLDAVTGVINTEFRFDKSVSGLLQQYLVK